MSMNKTAYETTACTGVVLKKTTDALKAAYYEGSLDLIAGTKIKAVIGGSAISNDVPAFAHPILLNIDNDELLFIDNRGFGKYDSSIGSFKVKNDVEYNLMIARAKLNYIWVKDNPKWLRDLSQLPISIYSSWISEAIGKRFGLDPREQFNLTILSAIFYNSQFSDEPTVHENEKLRMINTISKSLRASAKDVMEIVDKVSVINNVFEFCSHMEEVSGSIRLKEMNPGVLFTILGNTWFGSNSKEMVAVAIEHPPTWIAILLSAYTERTFKNSQIAKITERNNFKKGGDDFVRATLRLLSVTSTN